MRAFLRLLAAAALVACGSSNLQTMPGGAGGGAPLPNQGGPRDAGAGGGAAGGPQGGGVGGGVAGGDVGGGLAGGTAGGDAGGMAGGEAGGVAGGGAAGGSGGGMMGGGMAGCSAATCASGCCLNDTCQPGTQPLACGDNGAACVACMTGTTCQAQACAIDPASMWRIQPVSARIAMRKANGDSWDVSGGAPDVFVTLFCPATSSSGTDTPTINDSYMPAWAMGSCVMTAGALQSAGFAFSVTDEDGFLNPNDAITSKTTVRLVMQDFAAPTLMRGPVGQTQAITFSLSRM